METAFAEEALGYDINVPSLPTRDGNGPFRYGRVPSAPGSQPTYKGWKRSSSAPMTGISPSFPAYLQGMETRADDIVEDLHPPHVPSLPTRDGNRKSLR